MIRGKKFRELLIVDLGRGSNMKITKLIFITISYMVLFPFISIGTNFFVLRYLLNNKGINALEMMYFTVYRCVPISMIVGVAIGVLESYYLKNKLDCWSDRIIIVTLILFFLFAFIIQYVFFPLDIK